MKTRSLTVLMVVGILLIGASCRRGRKPAEVKTYHGVGVVESIDKNMKTIQINHEDIPDYMPAMSMAYRVKNPSLMDSVKSGDKVDFTIHDSPERGAVLTEVKKHDQ